MKELEITAIPPLGPGELSLLDMHSVVNVLNVLRGELTILGLTLADNEDLLAEGLAVCDRMLGSLHDPALALDEAARIEARESVVAADVASALAARPEKADDPEVAESLANLRSVFTILQIRAREILARASAPGRWESYPVDELQADFLKVFAAIEKNAKGRYRLLYNAALQEARDYYVDFKIEAAGAPAVMMPPVFKDVMRDLIANARKYTAPGGRITAALYEDATALRFVVEDSGRGIPEEELGAVVEFGRRASNVRDVRTMGGGFGLTKAFLVTKQFGGRFWIASALGVGTRVRITIPRSPALAAAG